MPSNMNRRGFMKSVGLGVTAMTLPGLRGTAKRESTEDRPNIILIMADDVSPDYFGCYGIRDIHTPNLDRMARQGVKFRTCWATALCTPTRAEIMTGRYGHRTGFFSNGLTMDQTDGSKNLNKHHHSFARLLNQAGYATAIAGKWHLGSGTPYSEVGGFDEYCLWESVKEIRKLKGTPEYTGGWENENTTSRYWHPGIVKNHALLRTKTTDFGPDMFTAFLCDFMEREKERPFLAYYPMVAPHGSRKGHTTTPLRGDVGMMEKQERQEERAKFKALNEYIDVLVGRIWKKVEDLGLAEKTILIFTSDNGTAVTAKSRGVERGCLVPFIVYGAGIKKRGATDALTDFSDILPTLVDFAGGKIPGGYDVDGKSLKPFLTGETDDHREWIYSSIGTTQLIRDKHYLLEAVNPLLGKPDGRFLYCGQNRNGRKYQNITGTKDPKSLKVLEGFRTVLRQFPPLTEDHPVFQTRAGKRWLRDYKKPRSVEKHLHNHQDYRFYEE